MSTCCSTYVKAVVVLRSKWLEKRMLIRDRKFSNSSTCFLFESLSTFLQLKFIDNPPRDVHFDLYCRNPHTLYFREVRQQKVAI